MIRRSVVAVGLGGFLLVAAAASGSAQPPGGGPGGPGGFMPPWEQAPRKLLAQFDKNGDGWLNAVERQAARDSLKKDAGQRGPGGFGPGGFGPGGRVKEAPRPGPKVSPVDVQTYPGAGLYDPAVLRTLFLDFEGKDWEAEVQDFHGTDVEVPATLTVDGKVYPNVGVHFRGMSSYGMVPAGSKRSFNLSMDFADPKQRLGGYKTLNLLNSHDDPSFLSTVLYSELARRHTPTPKANFVKVVVNGESWGVYPNVQQFDKQFLAENYQTDKGTRWKVRGSPGGGGGLDYLGDKPEDYKRRYTIKSADGEKPWQALIHLCKVLDQTPADKLEAALKPILDVDGLLWFLALDVALINNDGYWVRASDYTLYLDPKGKFHAVPHDMNEAFQPVGGGPGGPGGFGMRMPRPGEVLPSFVQDVLKMTDEQKKQLADLQKEVDGKLDALLTAPQKADLKRFSGPGGGTGGPVGPGGRPGGPGGPGGMAGPRGGNGIELDPLVALDDARKPLRSKVLAVTAFRAKYLANVKTIADESLDWKTLGPVVARYRALIDKEVEADTRKLDSLADFRRMTADEPVAAAPPGGRGPALSVRAFADQRRAYLLNHPEIKAAH